MFKYGSGDIPKVLKTVMNKQYRNYCTFNNKFNFRLNFKTLVRKGNKFNVSNRESKMFFSDKLNVSDDSPKDVKDLNKLFDNFNEEFDKVLSTNEEDLEKRVRLLSLKLLQCNQSKEILKIFEEKYVKGLVNKIYGEELSLMVYFYVSLLNKEAENVDLTSSYSYVDKKIEKILTQLYDKLNELDVVNLLALSWAVSLLISKFNYAINLPLRKAILNHLPKKLPIDKKGEIPTICFSISSFLNEDSELTEMLNDRIASYSSLFFSEVGLNHLSPLNLSLLMMSWTKVRLTDVDCLNSAASALIEIEEQFNEENIEEVCKIFWVFYVLNYKETESTNSFLTKFLEQNFDKVQIDHAIDLFISYSSLNSENVEVFDLLVDLIQKNHKTSEINLDISSYVNIWLGLSKFYIKTKEKAIDSVTIMLKFLLESYEKRKYLSVSQMNLDEVCSLLVCMSVLAMEPNRIFAELGTSVKDNIDKFNNIQLIQLLSCGKYLFNTKRHSDLYYRIHDALVASKSSFDNFQITRIKKILSNDAIITESVFLR